MAKKFNERLQEERAKEIQELKTDGTESAKVRLSPQTKGEKRKYTRLTTRENKTKIVTVLLTEKEYSELLHMAETLEYKSVSECIRHSINESISAFKGE